VKLKDARRKGGFSAIVVIKHFVLAKQKGRQRGMNIS
jgi:hypothetical protein